MKRWVVAGVAFVSLAAGCAQRTDHLAPGQPPSDPVIAAVGDIACNSLPSEHARHCRYDSVASILGQQHFDAFLALGDLQYLRGSYGDFVAYYDRFFGPYKDITYPVPGNHETYTPFMGGYVMYFGDRVHTPGSYITNAGFYSFDLGAWHIVALNSQLCLGSTWDPSTHTKGLPVVDDPFIAPGCGPGDSEYEWLKADLALHPSECTLVYYHHPVLVWNEFYPAPYWPGPFYYSMIPLWELLQENGVDVVLNGHYHNYQRFGPQDYQGNPDPNGPTEFIVGSGGDTYENFPNPAEIPPPPAYVTGTDSTFGMLELTLHPNGYDFEFVPAPGETPFADSGSGSCH
jgi:acid phosphatase type 7